MGRTRNGIKRELAAQTAVSILLLIFASACPADVENWQTGQSIPGTEGIEPGPGVDLSWRNTEDRNLRSGDFAGMDLTGASFSGSWLDNARFTGANITGASLRWSRLFNADLSGARVTGSNFSDTTSRGFTESQLYSTASYQDKNLQDIVLADNRLVGWDFREQELSGADFNGSTLNRVNLTGAVVKGADFRETTSEGFTKQQLFSTASYQDKDLQGITLRQNDLSGWDFSGQNLAGADLYSADLTNADLSGANLTHAFLGGVVLDDASLAGALVTGARFAGATGLTNEQLYSTASYQDKNLQGIWLDGHDLSGLDLGGHDLSRSMLSGSTLINTNLSEADLTGSQLFTPDDADLSGAVVTWASFGPGLTKEQLYSTASYREGDLRGIGLEGNDLSDWDFTGQDLGIADLSRSTLTNANLSGANLNSVNFTSRSDEFSGAVSLDSVVFSPETTYNQWTRFPGDFDPISAGLSYRVSPLGDFDGNGLLDIWDADILTIQLRGRSEMLVLGVPHRWAPWRMPAAMFNLNGDERNGEPNVNEEDLRIWVKKLKQTWFGDANLDGRFDHLDLVSLLQAGEYEDGLFRNSTWGTGDWNADGEFGRSDLLLALQDGGYGQSASATLASVPEPTAMTLTLGSLIGFIALTRRRLTRHHL